jgi:hypothetical protein
MAAFVIFVGGAGTEPDPLPVFVLDNEENAARICEGIGATEYRAYKFSFCEVGKADQSKFPFWAEMTLDARDGVYGDIAAGIYAMIDRAYAIISQRRVHQESVANQNTKAQSDGGSVKLPNNLCKDSPSKLDNVDAESAIPKPLEPYKWMEFLAEDAWVYEIIHANSFAELKVEHRKQCQSKKNFKKVLSRRAYWERADRYADYHGLRKRRFKGACKCPDCQTVTDTPLTPTDN